jgi:hypothetical protein
MKRVLRTCVIVVAVVTGLLSTAASAAEELDSPRLYALVEAPEALSVERVVPAKPQTDDGKGQVLFFSSGPDLMSGSFNDDDTRIGVLASLVKNASFKTSTEARLRKQAKVKKITINGNLAAASVSPTQVVIWWTQNQRQMALAYTGRGTTLARAKAIAATIRLVDDPTRPVRMKTPAGTELRVNATIGELTRSSKVTYVKSEEQAIGITVMKASPSVFELSFTSLVLIINTLGSGNLGPPLRLNPQSLVVNGNRGIRLDLLDESGLKSIFWSEPSGEFIQFTMFANSLDEVLAMAERVRVMTPGRAREVSAEAEVTQGFGKSPAQDLIAAGNAGTVPWAVNRLSGSDCVRILVATSTQRFCPPTGEAPLPIRWTSIVSGPSFFAVGVTRPEVRTVVLFDAAGNETGRTEVQPGSSNSFVIASATSLRSSSMTGLDASGAQIEGPVALSP